jgi:PhzF family phenazine biosynthesis protein
MQIKQFVVDAFTDRQFGGNPAAVCILEKLIAGKFMQEIASENALPETAFIKPNNNNSHDIRWFTPRFEMDLCGHATLASAHVLWHHLDYNGDKIHFDSRSGPLEVQRQDGRYILDFPARMPSSSTLPEPIKKSLNIQPVEVFKSRDYLLVYEDEQQIIELDPDERVLDGINIDPGGIIVTAPGEEVDFVSRFFTPGDRRFEDPVTGSAHSSLIPYWSERLNKKKLNAEQLSERYGTLVCENKGDRVLIGGSAKTFSEGTVYLDL